MISASAPDSALSRFVKDWTYAQLPGLWAGRRSLYAAGMAARPLDAQIDGLYQLPLDEFTAARNALAKESGAAAAEIRALQKPPVAAWAINQVYWRGRPAFHALTAAAAALGAAHTAVVTGKKADLRAAGKAHEDALEAVVKLRDRDPARRGSTRDRRNETGHRHDAARVAGLDGSSRTPHASPPADGFRAAGRLTRGRVARTGPAGCGSREGEEAGGVRIAKKGRRAREGGGQGEGGGGRGCPR